MKAMTLNDIKKDLREQAPTFAKEIAPVYKQLNLTWGNNLLPPNEHELEKTLLELINHLEFSDFGLANVESGRLIAWANKHERSYGIKFEYAYQHFTWEIEA